MELPAVRRAEFHTPRLKFVEDHANNSRCVLIYKAVDPAKDGVERGSIVVHHGLNQITVSSLHGMAECERVLRAWGARSGL